MRARWLARAHRSSKAIRRGNRDLNLTTTAVRAVAFVLLWFGEFSLVSGAVGILGQFGAGLASIQAGPVAISVLFLAFSVIQVLTALRLVYGDGRAVWVAVAIGAAGLVAVPFLLRLPLAVVLVTAVGYAFMLIAALWLARRTLEPPSPGAGDVAPASVFAALLLGVQSAVFALFLIAGALSGSLATLSYGIFAIAGLVGAGGILAGRSWGYPAGTGAAAGTAMVGVLLAMEVPIMGLVIFAAALTALVMLVRGRT